MKQSESARAARGLLMQYGDKLRHRGRVGRDGRKRRKQGGRTSDAR